MSQKNCHLLQDENLCMFSVKNSQFYLNKMTVESICDVLFVRKVNAKELKIKLFFSNFQKCSSEVSFRGM